MKTLPITTADSNGAAPAAPIGDGSPSYWHCLVGETAAADFLGLSKRTMQALRQKGGGAHFVKLSARCIRYRRADLKAWADERVRWSTSDPGPKTDPI